MSQSGISFLLLAACFVLLAFAEAIALRGRARREADTADRAVTNFGLAILVMLASGAPVLARVGASSLGAELGLGLARRWPQDWPLALAALLVSQSFAAYWVHRLFHTVPLLWRAHRVHHSDAHLDISTGLRNHPLELAVAVPVSAAVVLLLGASTGMVIAVDTALFAAALWQHVDCSLPARMEGVLGAVFVTPALHRAHHAPDRRLHDGNYGDILILWDRLFGTLSPRCRSDSRVGLDHQRARPDHLLDQLLSPLHPLHTDAARLDGELQLPLRTAEPGTAASR